MTQQSERALREAAATLAAAEAAYFASTAALAEAARSGSGSERRQAIRNADAICDERARVVRAAVLAYEASLQDWVDAGGDPCGVSPHC